MATDETIAEAKRNDDTREIRVYSHSNLFYWWPVWAFGLIAAAITFFEDNRMAILPPGSTLVTEQRDGLEVPARIDIDFQEPDAAALEKRIPKYFKDVTPAEGNAADVAELDPRASIKPWLGPMFLVVLLLVIMITNVPLRGLWSVVVIISIIMLTLIFALLGWWDDIFHAVGDLHIYINMSGYLFISGVLFAIWAVAVFVLDKRTYISFRPGQIRVREEIVGGERTFDTTGVAAEKKRDDLFRHWVLGLLSGDLVVHVRGGGRDEELRMPNVLAIGWKLSQIQDMLRKRDVV